MSESSEERLRKLNSPDAEERIDRFERELLGGRRPRIEDFALTDPTLRSVVLEELVQVELEYRLKRGEPVILDDYWKRFPELVADAGVISRLRQSFERHVSKETQFVASPSPAAKPPASPAALPPPQFLASSQLLFGIIALQNSFITREQLVAAFDAWVRDKSRGLADLLMSQNALSQADHDLLQRLVELFLKKHRGDADESLAALSSVAEVRPQLEQLLDPDVSACFGNLRRGRASSNEDAETILTGGGIPRGDRFRILRPHAEGGLGQVSVALDQELNREVALKEIQPRHADDPANRERFILEAEITGGLEHPGIVPVYALGQTPDGRPYYAMRFVKGDNLKTAIEAHHKPDNPNRQDPGARQLELRRLLGRFIDVCNAMEYAHSRGVLHRDLKPGNIMVGKYGETLVVDWGLAKAVGRQEIHSEETSLHPTTPLSSSGQTQPGSAIGTPAYMSPEQAAGKLDDLGPPSDVYSLGSTLYHILCGRPSIVKEVKVEKGNEEKGESLAELLSKIQRGDFPKPRVLIADVPPPLEAICLKAMKLNPADRYPTPRALADDLEHWLADEPITALTDSTSARVARWSRKHRGVVQAGSIAGILILIVSITFAVLFNLQRRKSDTLAHEKGELAETNRQLFESEQSAKIDAQKHQQLSDQRAESLKRSLARSYFDHGESEYADGRLSNAYADLTRAVAMTAEDDPLSGAYRRILADRLLQGGRQLAAPLWHADAVWSAAFSPDGSRIVTGSRDATARLWDGTTGRPLGEPMRHESAVFSVAFSPDGTRVVTGSSDKTVRLWDGATGRPLGEPMKHEDTWRGFAYSKDGARIATMCSNSLLLWEGTTGKPIGAPMIHRGDVERAAFSPDGTRLVTTCADKAARLWDTATGRALGEKMEHDDGVSRVVWSPDGTRIVTLAEDWGNKHARLWDGTTGRPIGEAFDKSFGVVSVAFSPDSARMISGHMNKTTRLWDASTGRCIGDPVRHDGAVLAVAFSPDGERILTGSENLVTSSYYDMESIVERGNLTARLWDATMTHPLRNRMELEGAIGRVEFSPDGSRIVTTSENGILRQWDAQTSEPLGEPIWSESEVFGFVISPDGTRVVTEGDKSTARLCDVTPVQPLGERDGWNDFNQDKTRVFARSRLWDVTTGRPIGKPMKHTDQSVRALSPDGTRAVTTAYRENVSRLWDAATGQPIGEPMKHDDPLETVTFSPDGSRLITVSPVGLVLLWDGQTGVRLAGPMRHFHYGREVEFSPDNSRFVIWTDGDTFQLCDATTGLPLGEPLRHVAGGSGSNVEFSPNGKRFVTGTVDNSVQLRDAITGLPLGEPLKHYAPIVRVAFSPDGARVLTVAYDGIVQLWDGTSGRPLGEPMKHDTQADAAFSPDGTRVITRCADTAQLWDGATGLPHGQPMRHPETVTSMAFSPDGSRVVTASKDKSARLWDAITGRPLGEPMWHKDVAQDVAFSPDGTRVVTGGGRVARLWDGLTGRPLGQQMRHSDKVLSVAFSPDGQRVVAGTEEDTGGRHNTRLWDAPVPSLVAVPKEKLTPSLELWTGMRSDGDGNLNELSHEELEQIRRTLGADDVFAECQIQKYARSRYWHQQVD